MTKEEAIRFLSSLHKDRTLTVDELEAIDIAIRSLSVLVPQGLDDNHPKRLRKAQPIREWLADIPPVEERIEELHRIRAEKNLDEAAEEYENWALSYSQADFPTSISYRQAFKAGAKWRDQQIPKLPDNIYGAAEKWCSDNLPDYLSYDAYEYSVTAFKVGAEWMAGQEETFEAEVYGAGDEIEAEICVNPKSVKPGDKVIVQIRKK